MKDSRVPLLLGPRLHIHFHVTPLCSLCSQIKEVGKVNVQLEQQRKSMSAEAKYRHVLGVISKEISARHLESEEGCSVFHP